MLKTIYSNAYEILEAYLTAEISEDKKASVNPFERVRVISGNSNINNRLRQHLAKTNGICSGVDFWTTQSWFHNYAGIGVGEPEEAQDFLWVIWSVLTDRFIADHPRLNTFFSHRTSAREKALARYELARKIATVFDKYVNYRFDWVAEWMGFTNVKAANVYKEVNAAQISKENVALIDLNFQLGDITTFMELKPSFDISYMLQNLDRINDEFLLSTLERYKQTNLFVLADPPYFKQADDIKPVQIVKLFNILKETFSYIVVDAEASFDAKNIAALTESDLIFLVTVANLPALRNSQRCLELFDKLGFDKNKIQILLNRYMENDEISEEDVENVIGRKIYWKIPNNYFTMMSAINKGIPVCVLNPNSNVANCYKNLAINLTDNIYRDNLMKNYENILGGN